MESGKKNNLIVHLLNKRASPLCLPTPLKTKHVSSNFTKTTQSQKKKNDAADSDFVHATKLWYFKYLNKNLKTDKQQHGKWQSSRAKRTISSLREVFLCSRGRITVLLQVLAPYAELLLRKRGQHRPSSPLLSPWVSLFSSLFLFVVTACYSCITVLRNIHPNVQIVKKHFSSD